MMVSNYMLYSSDIISHTAMLSPRSSSTATDSAGLSNAEKVTLYVIAATAAVLIVVGITIAFLRARCHDGPWAAHHSGESRQRSMAKALLKTIPLVQYDGTIGALPNMEKSSFDGSMKSSQAEDETTRSTSASEKTTSIVKTGNSTCAICTDEFLKNQILRVLPCSHLFHQNCVDEWLIKRARTCPTCRYELTPSAKEQPIEKAKHLRDMEVGLSDEAQHTQPHSRLHRYLCSLRSTLRKQ